MSCSLRAPMADTPSAPPSKKARSGEQDWHAEWEEAKTAHDQARGELGEALKMESSNDQYVQHLRDTVANAKEREQFAQNMLLKSQTQPSEVHQCPKGL